MRLGRGESVLIPAMLADVTLSSAGSAEVFQVQVPVS
jgi:hypothetical protein